MSCCKIFLVQTSSENIRISSFVTLPIISSQHHTRNCPAPVVKRYSQSHTGNLHEYSVVCSDCYKMVFLIAECRWWTGLGQVKTSVGSVGLGFKENRSTSDSDWCNPAAIIMLCVRRCVLALWSDVSQCTCMVAHITCTPVQDVTVWHDPQCHETALLFPSRHCRIWFSQELPWDSDLLTLNTKQRNPPHRTVRNVKWKIVRKSCDLHKNACDRTS